jgi:hypothetical protein
LLRVAWEGILFAVGELFAPCRVKTLLTGKISFDIFLDRRYLSIGMIPGPGTIFKTVLETSFSGDLSIFEIGVVAAVWTVFLVF